MTFRQRRIILNIILTIFSLAVIFPFYIMVVMGTYFSNDLFRGITILPSNYLFENLRTVMAGDFFRFFFNSVYVSIIATTGVVIVSAMAGYAFAKFEFTGKSIVFKVCLATMMIPGQLGLIAFVWQINRMGMGNTHLPIIIPPMASMFGVFWFMQFISGGVPNEIIESARIDGCSELRMFWVMVLPLIKPAISSLGVLFFLWNWNSYIVPLVTISRENLFTIPLFIRSLRDMHRLDFGAQILGLTIGTLPIITLYLIFSKNFISGLTSSAIKG